MESLRDFFRTPEIPKRSAFHLPLNQDLESDLNPEEPCSFVLVESTLLFISNLFKLFNFRLSSLAILPRIFQTAHSYAYILLDNLGDAFISFPQSWLEFPMFMRHIPIDPSIQNGQLYFHLLFGLTIFTFSLALLSICLFNLDIFQITFYWFQIIRPPLWKPSFYNSAESVITQLHLSRSCFSGFWLLFPAHKIDGRFSFLPLNRKSRKKKPDLVAGADNIICMPLQMLQARQTDNKEMEYHNEICRTRI